MKQHLFAAGSTQRAQENRKREEEYILRMNDKEEDDELMSATQMLVSAHSHPLQYLGHSFHALVFCLPLLTSLNQRKTELVGAYITHVVRQSSPAGDRER